MNSLQCSVCSTSFSDINEIIKHLKKVHSFKDGKQKISCVVDFEQKSYCTSTFFTFSGLRNHVKSCLLLKPKRNLDNSIEEANASVSLSSFNVFSRHEIKCIRNYSQNIQLNAPEMEHAPMLSNEISELALSFENMLELVCLKIAVCIKLLFE